MTARPNMKSSLTATLLIASTAAALLAACTKAPAPMSMPPPQVAFVTAHAQEVPLVRDLVGRLSATRQADVRARLWRRLAAGGTPAQALAEVGQQGERA